jgi:hypothetical protein
MFFAKNNAVSSKAEEKQKLKDFVFRPPDMDETEYINSPNRRTRALKFLAKAARLSKRYLKLFCCCCNGDAVEVVHKGPGVSIGSQEVAEESQAATREGGLGESLPHKAANKLSVASSEDSASQSSEPHSPTSPPVHTVRNKTIGKKRKSKEFIAERLTIRMSMIVEDLDNGTAVVSLRGTRSPDSHDDLKPKKQV